jgi:hypothetical protein
LSERWQSGIAPRADPLDSGTEDRSSDERRPPRQDAGPSSGGLSQGAAETGMGSGSEKSVRMEDVSVEQLEAASLSAADGQEEARAGVGGRG